MEKWKKIKDYEDYYKVSNTGKIFSVRANRQIKSFPSKLGYHDVYLKVDKVTKIMKLHRLVAKHFLPKTDLKEVNHIDGNKDNNHFNNLEWVSRSENMKHAFSTGLKKPKLGIDNNKAKLTENNIREIRQLRKDGYRLREISEEFGVTIANISEIVNYKTWKHIKE